MKMIWKNVETETISLDKTSLIWLRKYAKDHGYTLREAFYHLMREKAIQEYGEKAEKPSKSA